MRPYCSEDDFWRIQAFLRQMVAVLNQERRVPSLYASESDLGQYPEHILRRLQKLLGCFGEDSETGPIMPFPFAFESTLGNDQEWFAVIRFLEVEEVGVGTGTNSLAIIRICHGQSPPFNGDVKY
jgi:hypothetical protein